MRSVGGGYDNESIAVTAMCATFVCWARALRAPSRSSDDPTLGSYVYGFLTGLAYIYMVMAWGGFVFVLNMIGELRDRHRFLSISHLCTPTLRSSFVTPHLHE